MTILRLIALTIFLTVTSQGNAQSVRDYAIEVTASVQTTPPKIQLSWLRDSRTISLELYRKTPNSPSWGVPIALAANATNYNDTNVVAGTAYEYRVSKWTGDYAGEGYIQAGMELPLVESRGKVILIVDQTHAVSLATELTRLQQDLVGDGWTVLRHDVARMAVEPANTSTTVWTARSNELASVKALIKADYDADPATVKSVFLFGHVPVPYSGNLNPDGHPDHKGAWPADGFYGDMDGTWLDVSENTTLNPTQPSDSRNRNLPGDGKFDRGNWPSSLGDAEVELQVGRVDLANLPAFPQTESELLRQYLNKDHAFRHRRFTMERRGLIDDHLGVFIGEAFAACGWRSFAPFFGLTNTLAADWLTTLNSQNYLWGYGCGGGTYTSASGVATTAQLVTSDARVVFTMLFGSYFGDWDSQNNLLRATIATTNYTLTSVWAGRPYWVVHQMALGETIGFSAKLTQNNDWPLYSANGNVHEVFIALMGDPTLRMHVVAPLTNLVAVTNESGGVDLRWNPSPEAVLGYHVYRAPNAQGPFVRMNTTLLTETNYTDPGIAACTYMVRAVKLEVSGSGSYWNASQGIFHDFNPPAALPHLIITAENKGKVYGEPLPALTAAYSGFTNGDTPAVLDAPAVLSTSATSNSPAGTYPIHVSGAADANYDISFVDGTLTISRAATTGTLTSSTNPSLPGQAVSFGVTVNSVTPGLGTPGGSVQFRIDGQNAGGPVLLSGGGASHTNSALSLGWHSVAAEYSGDTNFSATSLLADQLVDTAPVAGADIIERDPTNGVKVSMATLLSNDSDADGDALYFLEAGPTSANGGSVYSDNGWVFYTPPAGFTNTDSFTYTISDDYSLSVTGLVTVNIRVDNGPSPNLGITDLGAGVFLIRGDGIPDRTYRIQSADDINGIDWQPLGTAKADTNGIFLFMDTTGSPQRFYRSASP